MKKRTIFILLILIFFSGSALFSTQITKVGVIDRAKILQTFYAESKGVRELEDMKKEIQDELVRLNDEIKMYEQKKLDAENKGDEEEALRLDNVIFNKKQYMQDYYRTKTNQLNEKQKSLTEDKEFAKELVDVISFVALSQGCSIVLDISTPGLLWSNEEVDITNMVMQRLQSMH